MQIRVIFLFEFNMGHKAMGHKLVTITTSNKNNTFEPATANECTMQWWFNKFYKGDKSLKMRSIVAGSYQKLTVTN